MPTLEAEVETTDGTTPIPVQATHTNCYDGSRGSLQGVASDWWEVSYKVHSSTGEDGHNAELRLQVFTAYQSLDLCMNPVDLQ